MKKKMRKEDHNYGFIVRSNEFKIFQEEEKNVCFSCAFPFRFLLSLRSTYEALTRCFNFFRKSLACLSPGRYSSARTQSESALKE